jgi:hypothetical protein
MTTKAKLDAAWAAAEPIIRAEIADQEKKFRIFSRRIDAGVREHWDEIRAVAERILDAGIDAAANVPDEPAAKMAE